ncbi:hypothetical protein [Burkholderia sp. S-53]|uniref:hypothetical protein n=1 Tax=Burkholderia sp. S-53 TaxID=2906514 RepID=UPI0021CE2B42|nr:hypothetical protein [Burkholderia sp. S-53]UXU87831.1 hypothetical protein LXM88_22115 [Burkholderia sp. S-53]
MDGATIDLAQAILETDDDVLAIRTLAELGHLVPESVTVAGTLASVSTTKRSPRYSYS